MKRPWTYQGQPVLVSPTADIPTDYRPGHRRAAVVQEVLNGVEPWSGGDDPIETMTDLAASLREIVVPQDRGRLVWAKHKGHHARRVGLSPFVMTRSGTTRAFTVELTGTPDRPRLVRAYPGEYVPPLPWQVSAGCAPGGRDACIAFWRRHAYVFRLSLVLPDSICDTPPAWFD